MTERPVNNGRFALFVPTLYEAGPFIKAYKALKTFENEHLILFESKTHGLIPVSGAGPKNAVKAYRELKKIHRIDVMLLSGIAGALEESLKVGDWIAVTKVKRWREDKGIKVENESIGVGHDLDKRNDYNWLSNKIKAISRHAEMVTGDSFVCGRDHKGMLFEMTKASLVDMEAYELALAAKDDGVPFFCIKVVSDLYKENIALDFSKFVGRFGKIDLGRIPTYLLQNPKRIPEFFRVMRKSGNITRSLFQLAGFVKRAS